MRRVRHLLALALSSAAAALSKRPVLFVTPPGWCVSDLNRLVEVCAAAARGGADAAARPRGALSTPFPHDSRRRVAASPRPHVSTHVSARTRRARVDARRAAAVANDARPPSRRAPSQVQLRDPDAPREAVVRAGAAVAAALAGTGCRVVVNGDGAEAAAARRPSGTRRS